MGKAKKICILINHHDDIKLFSKFFLDGSDLYYKDFNVKLGLKNLNFNINELKSKNFLNKKNNFFSYFKSNWFKDENNNDYTFFEKKFSIGNISRSYITRDLIAFLKNYYLYLQHKKNYDKVFISSHETYYFKKFANISKSKFLYYKSINSYPDLFGRDIQTKFDHNLIKIKNYFLVFRLLQNLFRSFLANRSLVPNDPTLKVFNKKKNFLVLNSINIFRSFYFIKPMIIKKNLPNSFRLVLKKKLIKFNLPHDFVNVFSEHVYKKLNNNLSFIFSYYLMISEMINFYKPKTIIIPSLSTFQGVLTQYACVNQNVEVLLAIDGSNAIPFNDFSFDKKFLKKNKINILAYSLEEQEYFKKFINNDNIKLHALPLHLNFKKNFKKKYDLVVLDYFWGFNDYSINSKHDYSYKILKDILTVVQNTNKKNIAIKFKKTNLKEYLMYQKFVKKNISKSFLKLNIDFLDADFSEALNYSNIFVGHMGTSFMETIYAKKKYIMYLPIEAGYDDNYVNKYSVYINSNKIVRNLSELKQELNSKKKIKLKEPLPG